MPKKENHNIPKDYEKSVKKKKSEEPEIDAIIGSSEGSASVKISKFPRLNISILNKRKPIFVGVVMILIIASGIVIYLINKPDANTANQGTLVGEVVIPAVINEGKTNDQALLEEFTTLSPELLMQSKSTNAKTSADAYKQLAYLALNAQKYDESLMYAQKYEEKDPGYLSAELIGNIAFRKGDYALSMQYYDIAMTRVPKEEDPAKDTLYNRYLAKKQQAAEQL